jgi:hypothetical protein
MYIILLTFVIVAAIKIPENAPVGSIAYKFKYNGNYKKINQFPPIPDFSLNANCSSRFSTFIKNTVLTFLFLTL